MVAMENDRGMVDPLQEDDCRRLQGRTEKHLQIALRLVAIATRVEAIASRFVLMLLGWRPSLPLTKQHLQAVHLLHPLCDQVNERMKMKEKGA